jgi:hypothetical protein
MKPDLSLRQNLADLVEIGMQHWLTPIVQMNMKGLADGGLIGNDLVHNTGEKVELHEALGPRRVDEITRLHVADRTGRTTQIASADHINEINMHRTATRVRVVNYMDDRKLRQSQTASIIATLWPGLAIRS